MAAIDLQRLREAARPAREIEEFGAFAMALHDFDALEPLEGIEIMQRHRKSAELLDLTRGPGRLAQALQIDRRHDGEIGRATGRRRPRNWQMQLMRKNTI